MLFTRQNHFDFLESELKAQTNAFKKKLDTVAQYLLLNRGEIFVSQFLAIKDGEMILKFSNNRSLPRKGEYLYCMLLPKELRNYHKWGEQTYGDLIKQKAYQTEIVCIWHAKSDDIGYSIAGFRGVDIDFAEIIQNKKGVILVLGPNKPPFECIINLQNVVNSSITERSRILDSDYVPHNWNPILLDNKKSVVDFIMSQIKLFPTLILQGPPGTGKTYMIAELCRNLCYQGKSVLVTALTNRALIEIASKPVVDDLMNNGKIFKTNLTSDEKHELPMLQKARDVSPMKGVLMLSTYYITSGSIADSTSHFDYVIMDEASQALLAMFEVSQRLGTYTLWIGDVKQLPPVVAISDDKIRQKGYLRLVDGLKSLTECSNIPIYQLTETYRLPARAAEYTGLFYNGNYHPKSEMKDFSLSQASCQQLLHRLGGPTLIKTDLPMGETAPKAILVFVSMIVQSLFNANKKIHIAVLSCMVETTKQLQRAILQTSGNHDNLIVETVARVQGLTTDVTIFVIPNSVTFRSLETRLFNVATSRSRGYTLIITDKDILKCSMSNEVRTYMEKLNTDYSYYFPFSEKYEFKLLEK